MITESFDPTARQLVPVISTPARTASDVDADQVSAILTLLDRALDVHRSMAALVNAAPFYYQVQQTSHLLTFFEKHSPHALYAMQLWAGAHGFHLAERVHEMDEPGLRFPVVDIVVGKDERGSLMRLASWHGIDLPRSAEPPRVTIEVADTWSPAQGAQP